MPGIFIGRLGYVLKIFSKELRPKTRCYMEIMQQRVFDRFLYGR